MPQTSKKIRAVQLNPIKDDEFYTLYDDIQKELSLYKDQLWGKKILCPCDSADSQFVKFLNNIKDDWGIVSIHYCNHGFEYLDFKQFDLIITNPPFSLYPKFFKKVAESHCQYLLVAPLTCITYANIWPQFKSNLAHVGYNQISQFSRPNGAIQTLGFCIWLTNLKVKPRELILTKSCYDTGEITDDHQYLNISKVKDIPFDYFGEMSVPTTFMRYYDSSKWDLIEKNDLIYVNRQNLFVKLIIKRKSK